MGKESVCRGETVPYGAKSSSFYALNVSCRREVALSAEEVVKAPDSTHSLERKAHRQRMHLRQFVDHGGVQQAVTRQDSP